MIDMIGARQEPALVPSNSILEKKRESERLQAEVEAFLAKGGHIKTEAAAFASIPWPMTDNQAMRMLVSVNRIAYLYAVSVGKLIELSKQPGFPVAYSHRGETKFSAIEIDAFLKKHNPIREVALGDDDDE